MEKFTLPLSHRSKVQAPLSHCVIRNVTHRCLSLYVLLSFDTQFKTNDYFLICKKEEDDNEETNEFEHDVVSKLDQTFRDCVMSPLFILNVIYFGVLCLRFFFFSLGFDRVLTILYCNFFLSVYF